MLKNTTICTLLLFSVFHLRGLCQETPLFKVSDFDLVGKIKSCLVSTDYGKEEYRFNQEGMLIESVTRFNDADYNVTLYELQNGELLEKRVEQYSNKVLDRATSIASFYTIDTTGNRKVTEKIVTYNKELLEQNEYFFTADEKLSKIIHTNNDGIDETSVIYYQEDDTSTAEYFLNNELQKSIQTTVAMQSDTIPITTITTKKFFEGKPNTAIEKIFNSDGKITTETHLTYNETLEKFVVSSTVVSIFEPLGVVGKTITDKEGSSDIKEYLYQFDPHGNWVKQIVKPDNRYKTRKITYYEMPTSIKEKE